MKIIKYEKVKNNAYKVYTQNECYVLYSDIIIKNELLIKKEITEAEFKKILKENNLIKAYYEGVKALNIKMRTKKEIDGLLKKKGFKEEEIKYTIDRLSKEGYLNNNKYIEAYIHDMLALQIVGENKIYQDLIKLGFKEEEIDKYLKKVNKEIYLDKIKKYIDKKLKSNKKSKQEFKIKTMNELINKGFLKEDIIKYLDNVDIEDNPLEIEKIVNKLYPKYLKKYDSNTAKLKVKGYLYNKGYTNIDIDLYIKKAFH